MSRQLHSTRICFAGYDFYMRERESAWLVCNLRTKLLEEDCNCWRLALYKNRRGE